MFDETIRVRAEVRRETEGALVRRFGRRTPERARAGGTLCR